MTKFAFLFPAKIVFAEHSIQPRRVDCEFDLYSFDGKDPFFDPKKEKVRIKDIDGYNTYYLLIEGYFVYANASDNDENCLGKLRGLGNSYDLYVEKARQNILNPKIYEEEARESREKFRLEREQRDKEQEELKKQRQIQAENAYLSAVEKFKQGEYLDWSYFERCCKENQVNIPIKTIGWGRKYVKSVSLNSYRLIGKSSSTVLGGIIRELNFRLTNQQSTLN